MNPLPYACLGAALLAVLSPSSSLAIGVTLTYGGTNSGSTLELKPGETCEAKQMVALGRYAVQQQPFLTGGIQIEVFKDGLYVPFFFPMDTSSGADMSKNRVCVTGPARITIASAGLPSNQIDAGGFATFEVTPAPAALEKLVVVPEGQGARLVLEASTNLNSWAPIFSTVLTNVPANQFIRVRSEKAP